MTAQKKVDLAILGAGTAGLAAFKEASKVCKNIILIDPGPIGTTCARIGCMPSKTFIQAANYFFERKFYSERGIHGADKITIKIPQLMKHVRKLREHFTSGIIDYTNSLGERFIQKPAFIDEPNTIKIANQKIIAKNIIIATGAHSLLPEQFSGFTDQILTSDNFFEQDNFESQMAVIGAGLIGLELGQALQRIGIKIEMFHAHQTLSKLSDPAINEYAIKLFQQEYSLHLNQRVNIIKNKDHFKIINENKVFKVNQILASLGRKPNLQHIDFKKLGIEVDEAGVPLFDPRTMQVKGTSIFIAGDLTKERQLLHEAADEGFIAGYNATHNLQYFERRTPLSIIFTDPNIAIIGQRYSELKEKQDFHVGEVCFENQGRSLIMSKNKGLLHIYADPNNGLILGAEMIAPAGEHMAHLLAWAIQRKMTVMDMLQMPFYHPAIEEGLRTALRKLAKKLKKSDMATHRDKKGALFF